MPERMTCHPLRESRSSCHLRQDALHQRRVQVMPRVDVGRVDERARGWKEVEPGPVGISRRDLAQEGLANAGRSDAGPAISLPDLARKPARTRHIRDRGFGERDPPVLITLSGADDDLAPIDVHILDPQGYAFLDPEPSAVEE